MSAETLDPARGGPCRERRTPTAIASFSVDPAEKRARALKAAPCPLRRSSTYTADVPEYSRTSRPISDVSLPSRIERV